MPIQIPDKHSHAASIISSAVVELPMCGAVCGGADNQYNHQRTALARLSGHGTDGTAAACNARSLDERGSL